MYLGIDLGTSSVKCLVIDEHQQTLASAADELTVDVPQNGYAEQHPQDWINALNNCFSQLKQALNLSNIRAISFSGQMHGAVCLDKNANVIRPAILWNDTRAHSQCQDLMSANPEVLTITGNLAMPGFTAPKLLWMRQHEPNLFAQVDKVLLPKDYLRFYLTGEFLSDVSDASGTYWLDVGQRSWSDTLLNLCDLNQDNMPTLSEGNQQTGVVSEYVCNQYGFTRRTQVIGGGGDNAVGAVGLGLYQMGDASVSLGTSGVIFTPTATFIHNHQDAIHSFCHALPKRWHLMSVMLSCTANINWFCRTFNCSLPEFFNHFETKLNRGNQDNQNNIPLYLPYLSGERTPLNDAFIRGTFSGIGLNTHISDLCYSVIEGVSFALLSNFQALIRSGVAIERLFVIGGGSQNNHWLRLLSTLFSKPLQLTEQSSAMAALGAARLAMLGYLNSTLEDVLTPPQITQTIMPNLAQTERLQKRFELWQKLYQANKSLAQEMYQHSQCH